MFERFTTEARRVVVDAQAHARRLDHRYIGSEHLLLALVGGENEAADVLRDLGLTPDAVEGALVRSVGWPALPPDRAALASIGIDLDQVLARAAAVFGPDAFRSAATRPLRRGWGFRRWRCQPRPGHIPFTPRAKKCLELSLREALALGHRHIGAEHIALGLARAHDGLAEHIIETLGTSPAQVRVEILRRQRLAG